MYPFICLAEVYKISTAHFATATRKNSNQCFQRSKFGTIFWRPRPEIEVEHVHFDMSVLVIINTTLEHF